MLRLTVNAWMTWFSFLCKHSLINTGLDMNSLLPFTQRRGAEYTVLDVSRATELCPLVSAECLTQPGCRNWVYKKASLEFAGGFMGQLGDVGVILVIRRLIV